VVRAAGEFNGPATPNWCAKYHTLIGGIDAQNAVSIALHKALGFQHAGTIRQVGFKFGRWLDLDFYQMILKSPANPVEG
jgi:phosphinothricin acetyltransferase